MTEFPGNSKRPQEPQENPKKIESVIQTEAVARKKSLGRRLKEIFIGGDSRSVMQYVFMDVLVPQAKDMLAEATSQGFERLIYGESRPGRRYPRPSAGANYTPYNRYSARGNNPIGRSQAMGSDRPPTASVRGHRIDDILLATRVEADTVLDRMYDFLQQYEMVSVAELYSLIGWTANYIDQKWGWTDLSGSSVQRVRDGYILNLPKPQSLD